MINTKTLTIGTDIEFAVVDENNTPRSVVGLLGGTKNEPLSIGNGCFRQEDNVNAEFSMEPVKNGDVDTFVNQILYCRQKGDELLAQHGLKLLAASSSHYSNEELDSEQAQVFGCEPSYSAYTEDIQEMPAPDEVGNLRTTGFHFHVGLPNVSEEDFFANLSTIVRILDVYMGLPSVSIDADQERRVLYGKPGDFRFRKWKDGWIFEYRSIGGGLLGSVETIQYMFKQLCIALQDIAEGKVNLQLLDECKERIQNAILKSDKEEAEQLMNMFGLPLPNITIFNENIVYSHV